MKKTTDSFKELVCGLGNKDWRDKKVSFMDVPSKDNDGVRAISLIVEGIDNEYDQFGDGKWPAHWEIYLMADGTWKIC